MMHKLIFAIASMMLIILYTTVFIVKEGERGIKLQFNSVVRDKNDYPIVYNPGLHFKIPFIQSVKTLEARIQTMDNQVDRFVTKEKKDLIINFYIKWRINDFSRYFLATEGGDITQAETLLKREFSNRLRSEIRLLSIKDIVTDSHGYLTFKIRNTLNLDSTRMRNIMSISYVDNKIITTPKNWLTTIVSTDTPIINLSIVDILGIEIVDIRIKQINLPVKVLEAVYNRMRAEREAITRCHRSKGQEKAEKLRATADYEVAKTLAEAKRQGCILRGEGDAEAAKLFADAFNQDPDFYSFIRSLRAYENSFHNSQDVVIFKPNGNFFRYMKIPNQTIQ